MRGDDALLSGVGIMSFCKKEICHFLLSFKYMKYVQNLSCFELMNHPSL